MMSTFDVALLSSSRAGADLGRESGWAPSSRNYKFDILSAI